MARCSMSICLMLVTDTPMLVQDEALACIPLSRLHFPWNGLGSCGYPSFLCHPQLALRPGGMGRTWYCLITLQSILYSEPTVAFFNEHM